MGMMLRRNVNNRATQKVAPKLAETKIEVENSVVNYTKTEINRMSVGDLRELAKKNGIEEVEKLSGSVLKRMLIEKLVWEL